MFRLESAGWWCGLVALFAAGTWGCDPQPIGTAQTQERDSRNMEILGIASAAVRDSDLSAEDQAAAIAAVESVRLKLPQLIVLDQDEYPSAPITFLA